MLGVSASQAGSGLRGGLNKCTFESPYWANPGSWQEFSGASLPAFSFPDVEIGSRTCPRPHSEMLTALDSLSSALCVLPAAPSLPDLCLLQFQLLPWVVTFHSGVFWGKNHSAFSLLSKRKGKKNCFLFFFFF